jgi:hypothetical protein
LTTSEAEDETGLEFRRARPRPNVNGHFGAIEVGCDALLKGGTGNGGEDSGSGGARNVGEGGTRVDDGGGVQEVVHLACGDIVGDLECPLRMRKS